MIHPSPGELVARRIPAAPLTERLPSRQEASRQNGKVVERFQLTDGLSVDVLTLGELATEYWRAVTTLRADRTLSDIDRRRLVIQFGTTPPITGCQR